jgi:hypothetical protein
MNGYCVRWSGCNSASGANKNAGFFILKPYAFKNISAIFLKAIDLKVSLGAL